MGTPEPASDITAVLRRVSDGDLEAREQLYTIVYQELRRLARRAMRGERRDHTLQATALVHETFLRLSRNTEIEWEDRKHFFAVAAKIMRRILVDHARALNAARRDGGYRAELPTNLALSEQNAEDILVVDQALESLEAIDPRQSQVVELRYFAGLSNDQVAAVLGVNARTVRRDWQMARAWLHSRLAE